MFFLPKTALVLSAFAAISLTAAGPKAAHAQDVISFDNFSNEPGVTGASQLSTANGGSSTYDGVTFSGNAYVVGGQASSNLGGFYVIPHSGGYAYAAANTQTTTLLTTKTLNGLYLGQINDSNAASSVTVNALGAYDPATRTYAVLGSTAADPLSSTTLSFFDTSSLASFAALPTFSGYSLVSQGASNNYDYAADDFTFGPVTPTPGPPTFTGKFDFDTDSVGTSANPNAIHTTFTDTSGGIAATFSSVNDTPYGGFRVFNTAGFTGFPDVSGNILLESGPENIPLSVSFDHILQNGTVAFNSNAANGIPGVFTVQELLNGVAVGTPVTSSTFGTVSFGGTSFNGLLLSDTDSQFAIDNLDVMGMSPVPEASTTVSFGLLLALGSMVIAKRKKASAA